MMKQDSRAFAILVVVGRDRPGLVSAVTHYLHGKKCNIEDAEGLTLGAYFAMLIRFSGSPQTVREIAQFASEWGRTQQLDIRVYEDAPAKAEPQNVVLYELRVDALDRIGIVDKVTTALARHHVNVRRIEGKVEPQPHTGILLFILNALIEIPEGSLPRVEAGLDRLGLDYVLTLYTG